MECTHRIPGLALLLVGLLAVPGCEGGGSNRELLSITVKPVAAEAQSPSGEGQFTATGDFSSAPTPVTPLSVFWSVIPPFSLQPQPAGVSVDQNGVARCAGFVGTISIFATAPADPGVPLSSMTMNTSNVSGRAQLTCH